MSISAVLRHYSLEPGRKASLVSVRTAQGCHASKGFRQALIGLQVRRAGSRRDLRGTLVARAAPLETITAASRYAVGEAGTSLVARRVEIGRSAGDNRRFLCKIEGENSQALLA